MSDSSSVHLAKAIDKARDDLRMLVEHVAAQHSGNMMVDSVLDLIDPADVNARLLQAVSRWYDEHAGDLFDDRAGAEQPAAELAAHAATNLRDIARSLRAALADQPRELDALRHLERRSLYVLEDDERRQEDHYFAITEIDFADGTDNDLSWCTREDIARFEARTSALHGIAG